MSSKEDPETGFVQEHAIDGDKPKEPAPNNGDGVRLSVVSQQYDRGNKGFLDPTEKAMREMDKKGAGNLDNNQVYYIVKEMQESQKKFMSLKKFVIFLMVFTVLLALATLGTAFAAATLAKEVSVNPQTGSLESAGKSHMDVSTVNKGLEMTLTPVEDGDGRKMMDDIMARCNAGTEIMAGTVPEAQARQLGKGGSHPSSISLNIGGTSHNMAVLSSSDEVIKDKGHFYYITVRTAAWGAGSSGDRVWELKIDCKGRSDCGLLTCTEVCDSDRGISCPAAGTGTCEDDPTDNAGPYCSCCMTSDCSGGYRCCAGTNYLGLGQCMPEDTICTEQVPCM